MLKKFTKEVSTKSPEVWIPALVRPAYRITTSRRDDGNETFLKRKAF
jgi:hypothetical protein